MYASIHSKLFELGHCESTWFAVPGSDEYHYVVHNVVQYIRRHDDTICVQHLFFFELSNYDCEKKYKGQKGGEPLATAHLHSTVTLTGTCLARACGRRRRCARTLCLCNVLIRAWGQGARQLRWIKTSVVRQGDGQ